MRNIIDTGGMDPNPFLKRLGLSNQDRAVIVHADDIGITESTVAAARELFAANAISSAAVMTPCAWFPATAQLCRSMPAIDMGVHATLNSESAAMRWSPLSTRDPASGLLDDDGCFHRTRAAAQTHARPEAVAAEIDAQVARAAHAGIEITHIDTHMGTVFHHALLPAYVQAGRKLRLPVMVPRLSEQEMVGWGVSPDHTAGFARMLDALADAGLPLIDKIFAMPLDKPANRAEQMMTAFDALPAGITHFIVHPSTDTPEIRAAHPGDYASRVADLHALLDVRVQAHVRTIGLHVIGYKALRDAMRR